MLNSVILPETGKSEWPVIRKKIFSKIWEEMGEFPCDPFVKHAEYEETGRDEQYGHTRILFRYNVYKEHWNEGFFTTGSL